MSSARRIVAIGDPQAPFDTFLQILKLNDLLTPALRLRDTVHLVSLGDHFDFGAASMREAAAADGQRILEWLASHGEDQVTLIMGNHDVARVCELAPFSDETFIEARAFAEQIYKSGGEERELLQRYPSVPDAECLARDFSCFTVSQRDLVTRLLKERRLRLAAAFGDSLCIHAGITVPEMRGVGLAPTASAKETASALNAFLDARVSQWSSGALNLEPLHVAGSAAKGEGVGLLFHRPADPASDSQAERFSAPPARRYAPQQLPTGFVQVIGHIGDTKCRELMPNWCIADAEPGALRSLKNTATSCTYRTGLQPGAALIFCDGAMVKVKPEVYRLHELST